MADLNEDFQAAHEIGKIYNSFLDKTYLCDFFLESAVSLIEAGEGFLFLAGRDQKMWLESRTPFSEDPVADLQAAAEAAFKSGKPIFKDKELFIPLIVRSGAIGMACFLRNGTAAFSKKDFDLATDLSSQLASALKNILLFEENLKMERLAAIGQTTSMVIHEIKNIIQLAKFADEYLNIGITKKDEKFLTKGLDRMRKAIREMDGFTYEMLSLTKDYKIQPQQIDWPGLLGELKMDLNEKAQQYNVELDFEVEGELGTVLGESRSLYRAVLNMVKNAIEACDKEKSFIRIRIQSKDADQYVITIEDNGQGMTDEVKAKMFQAFFSTKGERGTGLGLLVIDRTVKAHAGKIALESEYGKGTKFTLTFPKKLPD